MHTVRAADSSTVVLLVHAPYPGHLKFRGVPSSMLAAAAPFVRHWCDRWPVGYVDPVASSAEFYGQLKEILGSGRIRAVCISTSTAAIEETSRIAALAKNTRPDALVVAGGPHEDDCSPPVTARIPDVDVSIGGDAEFALEFVLRDFLEREERPAAFVPGLAARLRSARIAAGRFQLTMRDEDRPKTESFDRGSIPVTDLETHVLPNRLPRFDVFGAPTTLPVMVSRGCPYGRCTFCAEAIRGGGVRVTESFDWLLRLHEAHPNAAVFCQDSIFPRGPAVRARLLPLLRGLGVEWGAQVYLRALTRETVDELAAHGCTYLYTGLESASPELLGAVGKLGMGPDLALERLGWIRDAGMRVGISLMFGVMATTGELMETETTIASTLDLARDIRRAGVDVTGFYPNVQTVLPGTALARGLAASGHSLDFYRMPRTATFDVLEDGGVGHNFATIAPSRDTERIAAAIRDAALELRASDQATGLHGTRLLEHEWEAAPRARVNLLHATRG